MRIDKKFKGLERLGNGDYFLKGEIKTNEELIIELDDILKVEKGVYAKRIEINTTLIAGGGIKAGLGIKAGWGIEAGLGIKAGWGIEAGGEIKAGYGIEAVTFISSQTRIFAGISVYRGSDDCDKTIKCAELRNGEIAYGDLIITKPKEEPIEEMTLKEVCEKLGKNIKIIK